MDNYRVVGAFDTETSNIGDAIEGFSAFPVSYQLGIFNCNALDITPENVQEKVTVSIFRHYKELNVFLDSFIAKARPYVSVVLVHNLGFDMYALAPFLNSHDVKVLAKTAKKPISFQVLNDKGKPCLVFLDTMGIFMKSLATLGEECGMPKLTGSWDYSKARTPRTDLTSNELSYSKGDIYTLCAYMGYFLRQNPDLNPSDIGLRIQTKTGVVRSKRMRHVGNLKSTKQKIKVRQYWHLQNMEQKPSNDDELFTMHASTRGGFTFCARNNASVCFHATNGHIIRSYDSTSQHPAQMASHLYPIGFKKANPDQLKTAFDICLSRTINGVLDNWLKPFPYAFYACFAFVNLRPKKGTVFECEGIYSIASARIENSAPVFDNQANSEFQDYIGARGYKDSAIGGVFSFGKMESCESCTLYLTELEAWVMSRCYEWDSVHALSGYMSSTFRKPSDMSILSVMRFYKAKNALKEFMGRYEPNKPNDTKSIDDLYPDSFTRRCKDGIAAYAELKEYYMLAKADLNSLFGIEATNECRRDYELDGSEGLRLVGEDGLHNMPKNPKCNYQYGQRIVGWSRVAQICVMELLSPHVDNIICGDTDSIKVYMKAESIAQVDKALSRYAKAVNKGKKLCLERVRVCFPNQYDSLPEIGHYVLDGEYSAFCASWNKCYLSYNDGFHAVIAGVPASKRDSINGSFNDFCDALLADGMTFDDIASLVIGYNVTIDYSITKLNARYHPKKFGETLNKVVTDYKGDKCLVNEPCALALFPGIKTIGDTSNAENARNCDIAKANNPNVNTRPVWLKWRDGKAVMER